MSRGEELAKNTTILAAGKICTQFISFFLLPVYTTVLSTEEYGLVDLYTTYVSLAVAVLSLQLDSGIFRFLIEYRKDEKSKVKFISSITVCTLLQLAVCVCFYMLVQHWITLPHKIYFLFNVLVVIVSNLFLQVARGLGNNITYSLGSLISAASTIGFNIVFLLSLHMKSDGMMLATCLGNLCSSIFMMFQLRYWRYLNFKSLSFDMVKEAISYSLPLVPNNLSWWVLNVSDRTIVSIFMGVGANGLIAIAHKFSTVITTFYGIFNLAWTEMASVHVKDQDSQEYFQGMVKDIFVLSSSVCMGVIAFMPFVFHWLVNGDYDKAFYQIPIYMLAALVNILGSLYGTIYIAHKKTSEIAKTSFYAAILNILINASLIQIIGLYAVSLSTLIAYLVMFVIRYYDSRKYMCVKLSMKYTLPQISMYALVLVIYYLRIPILNFLMLGSVILFSVFSNWHIIKILLGIMMMKLEKKVVSKEKES